MYEDLAYLWGNIDCQITLDLKISPLDLSRAFLFIL